jgi:hypothetical protein
MLTGRKEPSGFRDEITTAIGQVSTRTAVEVGCIGKHHKGTDKRNESIAGLNEQVSAIELEKQNARDRLRRRIYPRQFGHCYEPMRCCNKTSQRDRTKFDLEKAKGVSPELEQAKGGLGIAYNTHFRVLRYLENHSGA